MANSTYYVQGPGPCYLAAGDRDGWKFFWSDLIDDAMKWPEEKHAQMGLKLARDTQPELFPNCYPKYPSVAVHHET